MENVVYGFGAKIPGQAKKVWQGDIFSAWQWQQELYDGSTTKYEALERPDTSHTVGVLPDGKILLVEDTQPLRDSAITPAGGVVEAGETPEEAARREFQEETGYEIGHLTYWHGYQPSGKIKWTVHAFVGRNLVKTGQRALEAGEKIELLTYSFEEFLELGRDPKMRDAIIRIILLEALLDKRKRAELKELFYG